MIDVTNWMEMLEARQRALDAGKSPQLLPTPCTTIDGKQVVVCPWSGMQFADAAPSLDGAVRAIYLHLLKGRRLVSQLKCQSSMGEALDAARSYFDAALKATPSN